MLVILSSNGARVPSSQVMGSQLVDTMECLIGCRTIVAVPPGLCSDFQSSVHSDVIILSLFQYLDVILLSFFRPRLCFQLVLVFTIPQISTSSATINLHIS